LLDKERDDMKRAILILILCAVFLSACGNAAETAERSVSVDTSAVSQTTTAVTVSAVTSAKEEKDTSEATTTTFKTSLQTVSETSKPTNITVTTTKKSDPSGYSGNSGQGQNNSVQNNNYQPVQNDPQPDNSPSDNNRSNNGAEQNNDPTPPTTTAKPAVTNLPTTTTPKPQITVPQTQPPLPVPTEEERYMDIGRSLSHNGSDYSKAEAVYNWMTENGSGTCVNYSWQTYYLCKGTGLECYLAWTPSKLYGHVANVVKVNGTWFVLDTQGQGFLLNNDCGFSEIIDIDESYVSVADLISNQRYDEIY
jgi:predicted small secreted protein